SKSALHGLVVSASREFAADGIYINAILPGYLKTGMGLKNPEAIKRAEEESITSQTGEIENLTGFILFLAGSRGVTGQIFSLENRI
ncbi:MAG: SDR family oxidoreductase, partial [Nitrospirae bacterium]